MFEGVQSPIILAKRSVCVALFGALLLVSQALPVDARAADSSSPGEWSRGPGAPLVEAFGGDATRPASASAPVSGQDVVWRRVVHNGTTYDLHAVSDEPLGGAFPQGPLLFAEHGPSVTDVYAVDVATGQPADLHLTKLLVSLVQTSYKAPALPTVPLSAEPGIDGTDLSLVGAPYSLYTSRYFSTTFVTDFVRGGLPNGLDDFGYRANLYGDLFFDMALQPDLANDPQEEQVYQSFLDSIGALESFESALGGAIEFFQWATSDPIDWQDFEDGLSSLKASRDRFLDLDELPSNVDTPFDDLFETISDLDSIQALSGAACRALFIATLANERALMRIRLLEDFVDRAAGQPGFDPAMAQGVTRAKTQIEDFVEDYYGALASVFLEAVAEDALGILQLDKMAEKLVTRFLGRQAAATFARVAMPYYLSYEVYGLIRDQQDRARLASLAATVQRQLFESHGLAHHRTAMHLGNDLDAVETQAFAELLQMSWYLGNRHYLDTLETLNNRVSRIWGAGIDFFVGGIYSAQIELLEHNLGSRRLASVRLAPPGYLAGYREPFAVNPQDPDFPWLMGLARDVVVTQPSAPLSSLLGICVTLPFAPGGTPATLEGMNIRFEPRSCGDPGSTQPWACSDADPNSCTARVQLFWDDDQNPDNADCENGSGPCPIVGAEDLSPRRGRFLWRAAKDGLGRGTYDVIARIVDGTARASDRSDGPYTFIDPIYEADAWRVTAVEFGEGDVADGDGVPERAEDLSVELLMQNTSGRDLENVKIHSLRFAGPAAQHLLDQGWERLEDPDISHVHDGDVLLPNTADGEFQLTSDDFDLYIGTESDLEVELVAQVEYLDPGHPVDPQLRRVQEIGFTVQISDGSAAPTFRCDHTDLEEDTDGDGIFESGERGEFTATLCNDGTWTAQHVRGTFDDPPPLGEWRDDDAPFPNLSPTECQPSDDDYALRAERHECGDLLLPMTVAYQGGSQTGVNCTLSIACAPYQSIQDEQDVGVFMAGDPVSATISIGNPGANVLLVSSVSEASGAGDTTIDVFPSSLPAGDQGVVALTIDTTSLLPGRHERRIRIDSNANNTDERESLVAFGIIGDDVAEQLTTRGLGSGRPVDVSGNVAVYETGNDLYVLDLVTRIETRLTDTPDRERSPRISGRRIAFLRDQGDSATADIFVLDLDTGQELRVTDHPGKQVDPDIHGATVVWQDERDGPTDSDIFAYEIGSSAINGTSLVELGVAGRAARDPRIEEDYVAFVVNQVGSPRDFGYLDRGDGSVHLVGLFNQQPCAAGNLFDIFDRHLAFECDCGLACDTDDHIYYVDMDARSTPHRLTCNASIGDDREEPYIQGDEVFYISTDNEDLYSVAIGPGCQTEVPRQVGPQIIQRPAGDPRDEAYVFFDNRTGPFELWGVLPPPAIDVSVASFEARDAQFVQGASYPLDVQIRNVGQDPITGVQVRVTDDGDSVCMESIASLAAGGLHAFVCTWDTTGAAVGVHTLRAFLNPPPAGDGNAANDSRELMVTVEDDDDAGPSITGIAVAAGPGDDGDPYLEAGEPLTVSWRASDPSGVATTEARLAGQTMPGVLQPDGRYAATFASPGTGMFTAEVFATDADDSPITTGPVPEPVEVLPAFPEVVVTVPGDGAVDVDPRSPVTATFSVEMSQGSISSATFFLVPMTEGNAVAADVTYDPLSRTATLVPDDEMMSITTYTATLLGGAMGVLDIRQNPLPADVIWTFTTTDIRHPRVTSVGSVADTGDDAVSEGEITNAAIGSLLVRFDEAMDDPAGNGTPGDVTNPQSYLLVTAAGDGLDTESCVAGPAVGDVTLVLADPVYDGATETATLTFDGVPMLADGLYGLYACGLLEDLKGNELDGNADGEGGDDFRRVFRVDRTAPVDPVLESPSHAVDTWTNAATIVLEWFGASDPMPESGLAGYALVVDGDPSTVPTPAVDIAQSSDPHTTDSGPRADGTWYAHLRTCDQAANCSAGVHAGPFQIDATPPPSPADLTSPSHGAGTPSNDPTIALTWTSVVDATSGVAGYGLEVSPAPTWACDGVVDLAAGASNVTTDALADGTWYAHLCALDAAGNRSATATVGPIRIDTVAPTVTAVGTVAATDDGVLSGGEALEITVTQVIVNFSEPMHDPAGDAGSDDVTNPSNYRLLADGGDGFDTGSCATPIQPGDVAWTIQAVQYDAATQVASLRLDAPAGLAAGRYRLDVCGSTSVTDEATNALDGDGDGQAGDDFKIGFEVLVDTLLRNPNFDQDLASWTRSSPQVDEIAHDALDADGAPTSGSARVTNLHGPGGFYTLSQCVEVDGSARYRLGSRVRVASGSATDPVAGLGVDFFDQIDCGGSLVDQIAVASVVGDTPVDVWSSALAGELAAPPGAVSARVWLTVDAGSSASFQTHFDRGFCYAVPPLFADGFESAGTDGWDQVVP